MTFETDDETRESIALARQIARMSRYSIDASDDQLEDAIYTMNRLIESAKAIFADKPDDTDHDCHGCDTMRDKGISGTCPICDAEFHFDEESGA